MDDEKNRDKNSDSGIASDRHAGVDARDANEEARSQGRAEVEPSPPTPSFSQASQVGRAQSGGSPESSIEPDETVREGWVAPDQTDTPPEWPEPTID